ncbi:hypothetical protein AB0J37_38385 [Microbispora rosea]|uniref:hypothetical protein n=1 Tax=Microbispora rosea TaxID=58117 RepID=UPI00344401BB
MRSQLDSDSISRGPVGCCCCRRFSAIHVPCKVIADLALTLALGVDCLADIAMPRAQPELFGPIASDSTVSWLIDRLAADPARAFKAIGAAHATARQRAWALTGQQAWGADGDPVPRWPEEVCSDEAVPGCSSVANSPLSRPRRIRFSKRSSTSR